MDIITSDMTIEQARKNFCEDKFATAAGCRIVDFAPGYAVCEMELDRELHYNGMGAVMGGAIFTLADFALAVGCNVDEAPTVSVSNTIEFLSATRGEKLTATCRADKSGRSLGYYTVDVTDDLGKAIARMTATCFRSAK